MLTACASADLQKAYEAMKSLCDMGYSPVDIITTVFKVRWGVRAAVVAQTQLGVDAARFCDARPRAEPPPPHTHTSAHTRQVARTCDVQEWIKLEFLKEIGFRHMRIGDGVNSRLQLSGMLAKLCKTALAAGGGS
jgi:replication factor C subunit 2/4